MTDVTLEVLGAQMAQLLRELAEMRGEMAAMRAAMLHIRRDSHLDAVGAVLRRGEFVALVTGPGYNPSAFPSSSGSRAMLMAIPRASSFVSTFLPTAPVLKKTGRRLIVSKDWLAGWRNVIGSARK